jgi:iron(III) transport system permease protein
MVLVQALFPGALQGNWSFAGIDSLLHIFQRRLWQVSLVNSLQLAFGTALLGGLIGIGLAMLRHSLRFRGAFVLDACTWTLLVMPSFVIAQGWILFAARDGVATQWFGFEGIPALVFSPLGLICIMSLKNYPFAYLAVAAAMQWQVREYGHAAQLCGASRARVLATVRLPMLLPAILSGVVLVFIDTIGDFGLPAALATSYRYPTLPYTIYAAINQSPIRFDLAGVLSFYLVLILAAAVTLYFWLLRRARYDFLTARAQPQTLAPSRYSPLCTLLTITFLALAIGIPIGTSLSVSLVEHIGAGLTLDNFTLAHYQAALTEGSKLRQALANSLAIACQAAVGSLLVSLCAAYLLTFSRFSLNRLIDVTCTATLAVPGVIIGVGFIFVWNHPVADALGIRLYGHPAILVLASMAGAIPIAIRVVLGAMGQIPGSYLQAAALQGASLSRRLVTILVPLCAAALLSAALAAFGTSVFDLAITSLLHPPGYEVLPVTIDRLFQQGDYGQSTAFTLTAGAAVVTLILLIHTAVRHFAISPSPAAPPAFGTPSHA